MVLVFFFFFLLCFNGNILNVRLKEYSVIIFLSITEIQVKRTHLFLLMLKMIKLAISVFFSLVPNECLSYS